MARYVAKNIVAAGLATRCEVQVAYAIGVAEPVSIRVDTFGTGKLDDGELEQHRAQALRPDARAASSTTSTCCAPIYRATAIHGHFGRNGDAFTWERTTGRTSCAATAGLGRPR